MGYDKFYNMERRSAMETIRTAVMDIGEPRQLVLPCPVCGDNKGSIKKTPFRPKKTFRKYFHHKILD
jgi:hypothetical protein